MNGRQERAGKGLVEEKIYGGDVIVRAACSMQMHSRTPYMQDRSSRKSFLL
jgi:hypothetical protein